MLEREKAMELLIAQNPDDYLLKHSVYSEAIMRALALKLGADPELWGLCGLLHDIDYPLTKNDVEQHGLKAKELLAGTGCNDACLQAIMSHSSEFSGIEPASELDFALRCAESVTGLISAAALIRPDGFNGMQSKSLKKKMKDKSFAAAVSRDRVKECEKIGLQLDEFLEISIKAMAELS